MVPNGEYRFYCSFFIHYLDKVAIVCKEILASLAGNGGEQLCGAVHLEFSIARCCVSCRDLNWAPNIKVILQTHE